MCSTVGGLDTSTGLAGETGTNSGSTQAVSEGTVTSVAGMDNSTSGLKSSSTFCLGCLHPSGSLLDPGDTHLPVAAAFDLRVVPRLHLPPVHSM